MPGTVRGGSELGYGDLVRTMNAIAAHHQVKTSLMLEPTIGKGTGLRVSALAVAMPPMGTADPGEEQATWGVVRELVSPDTSDLAPLAYRCLIDLDVMLSEVRWAQLPLLG